MIPALALAALAALSMAAGNPADIEVVAPYRRRTTKHPAKPTGKSKTAAKRKAQHKARMKGRKA